MDTAGSILNNDVKELLSYTDLVILDIKHTDAAAYDDLCGQPVPNKNVEIASGTKNYNCHCEPACKDGQTKQSVPIYDRVLAFLEYCASENKRLWLRQVVIPTINDTKEQVLRLRDLARQYNAEKAELLAYHTMGVSKWEKLGLDYTLKGISPMDEKAIGKLRKSLD